MLKRLVVGALVAGLTVLAPQAPVVAAPASTATAPAVVRTPAPSAAVPVTARRHKAKLTKKQKRRLEQQRLRRIRIAEARRRAAAHRAAVLAAQKLAAQKAAALKATTDACGARPRKADGSYWSCTFVDDFDGTGLDTRRWSVQTTAATGFYNARECYVDDPDNVRVGEGTLQLTVRRESASVACPHLQGDPDATTDLTAGMVTSYGKFAQAYGRFAFRVRFPETRVGGVATPGVHSALWLWPQDQSRYGAWPGSGEIDVAELYSAYPDRLIPYLHYTPVSSSFQVTNNYCLVPDLDTRFHDVVLEWTPTTITVRYDGQSPCVRTNWLSLLGGTAPFDQPFFMSLTQGLGLYGNALTDATRLPATLTIDSVKVWR